MTPESSIMNTSTSRLLLTAGFATGVLQGFYGLIKENEDLDVSKRIKHKQQLNKTPSPLTLMHTSLPFSENILSTRIPTILSHNKHYEKKTKLL